MQRWERMVLRLARVQHGLMTRSQVLECGATLREIEWRLRDGRWDRIHNNVYRIAGTAVSWEQRLLAATLWAGDGAAVSHRAAGELWKLDAVSAGFVEISTWRRLRAKDVTVHRMRVEPEETARTRSMPITDPTRTLLDLGAVLTIKELERAMESALRRGLTHLALIEARLEQRGRSGRNGTRAWRELLAMRSPQLRPTESDFETLMTQLIRDHGLPEPVRQLQIKRGGRILKRADFAYPDEMVVIEADGVDPHLNTEQWRKDRQQDNQLNLIGWVVLRFTRQEVVESPPEVAEIIGETLELRRSLNFADHFPR